MMKNRAGLLALAVLAIAIVLMVFFVMPRIGPDAAKVGDAINQAGNEVKSTVNEAAKTSRSVVADAAAVAEKIGRLTADAGQSLSELKALLADGKGPAADVLTAARTKAWAAAMTRRVPRVAPSAARVAWSVCCSARVSAVEVRTTTRMRTAKTPRRIATKSRSSRWKPSSRCTPTSSPSRSDIRSRTASETGAPSGSRTVHESTRVGQSFVSGVPAAKARLPPSRRPAESLVSGRCTAGTAVSRVARP